MKECQLFLPPNLPVDTIPRDRMRKAIRTATRAGKWGALCAPGGSGKTIAVVQNMDTGQGNCAWLNVSRTDSDPASFYGRFFAAVASARGEVAVQNRPMSLETSLRELQKLSRARLKGWLVLDDIHLLEHEVLAALPKSFNLALKAGRVRVLDATELAFTNEEADALYTFAGQKVDREELDTAVYRGNIWLHPHVKRFLGDSCSSVSDHYQRKETTEQKERSIST